MAKSQKQKKSSKKPSAKKSARKKSPVIAAAAQSGARPVDMLAAIQARRQKAGLL